MKLQSYLGRIGFRGAPRPDIATLCSLMRAHVMSIPFENLSVQLGAPVDLDPEKSFDKIIRCGRGGWCYEMNGLFGWALDEIGFDVTRLAGGVMRETRGDAALGNHLCLLVAIDQPYLVDVGFGGSLFAPIALSEATHRHSPYGLSLSRVDGAYWRFTEDAGEGPFGYDFTPTPADESLLMQQCTLQQTDPESTFVQNFVAQKRAEDRHFVLRGRVLKTVFAGGATKRLVQSAEEFVEILGAQFGLDVPEAAGLWPDICARHNALFGAASQS